MSLPNPLEHRTADHPIEQLFLKRWSPRAMSGESIKTEQLMSLLEAARWAPSTYNEQEWRFLYATRDSEHWETFFDLLVEQNQAWCKPAAALIVVVSAKIMSRNGKPNPVHSFDAGLATENLLLQAAALDLVGHGLAGFDQDAAREKLNVPGDFEIQAMIAVGHPGDPADLPKEMQEMETPSSRKPLSEIAAIGNLERGQRRPVRVLSVFVPSGRSDSRQGFPSPLSPRLKSND